MKMSLGRKIVISVVGIALLLSCTSICVSGAVIKSMMEKEYTVTSDCMAATAATTVDGDTMQIITDKVMDIYNASDNKMDNTQWEEAGFEEYAEQYMHLMDDEAYISIRDSLRKIQDVSETDCIYTLKVDPDKKTLIYIVDAAYDEDEIVTPGCFDLMEESCYKYLDTPEKGLPAFITDTEEYGWMITSCAPIYNSAGEIVCFAAVDISMNEIVKTEHRFILELTAILLMLTVIISVVSIIFVKMNILKPINMLSKAAEHYGKQVDSEHKEFENIDIQTGDELEVLLRSMVQMERDIGNYINNLTQTREQLSNARHQANEMHELAHMDSLTGIRNRMAYDNEVMKLEGEIKIGMRSFGIAIIDMNFLKRINDTYGHECGNSAIVKLSKLICDTFAHSPVFRIGGDEFAVILKNNDFRNIDTLRYEFETKLEEFANDTSLQEWEKISAAFGYAAFDIEIDSTADDVFKRADQAMYENKKVMKAERTI